MKKHKKNKKQKNQVELGKNFYKKSGKYFLIFF
jgi:hypothetical protein